MLPHHVGFTSDSNGNFKLYIDGELKYEITSASLNGTLQTGGYMVFGQEQDSLGGGFQLAESLTEVQISEIRIWDTVRTQGELVGLMNKRLYDNVEIINDKTFVNIQGLFSYYVGGAVDDYSVNGNEIYYDYGFAENHLTASTDFYAQSYDNSLLVNYNDNSCQYSISKNNGSTWESITPGLLTDISSINGTTIRLKIVIPANIYRSLNCYSIGWT